VFFSFLVLVIIMIFIIIVIYLYLYYIKYYITIRYLSCVRVLYMYKLILH